MKRFVCLIMAILMCLSTAFVLMSCDESTDHTHRYGEWETVLEASCNVAGVRVRSCQCGDFQTKEIPAKGVHSYGEWKTVLEANCGTKGVRVRSCGCGDIDTGEIDATGKHSFDENGVCTVCQSVKEDTGAHTHSFGEWETATQPTCNAKGLLVRKCACGASETQELDATGVHSLGEWQELVASTCAKKGIAARRCACGYYEKQALPEKTNHAYLGKVCIVCGHKKPSKVEVNVNANVKVDSDGVRWAEDEWGVWREYDNLPDDLDYNDSISFLYWTGSTTVRPEFEQVEEVDDARLSSIYKRNREIEERLGVELNFIAEPGDAGTQSTFVARVQRAKDAGTHDFDLIGSYAPAAGLLLMTGLLQNITAVQNNYIELSKPWWPEGLARNMAIGGNLYFLSGDCSTNAIDQMCCIYYNKDLLNERYEQDAIDYFSKNAHVKTPKQGAEGGDTASNMVYEKVYAGKWTLDEFIYLASDTYIDRRGDGVTVDDTFGLCSTTSALTALYGASNLRMIETTTDDTVLKISDDWTSHKTVRLIAKLYTLLGTTSYCTTGRLLNYGSAYYNMPFYNGTGFFSLHYMRQAESSLVNNDKVENYGVLPCPKFDLNQKNYYTVIGNEFSMYSIFVDCDKRGNEQQTLSMLTAVLECWGSEAYRKTTPVIFELNLKLKASPTQCDADMCEIIRASIEVDLGRVLRAQLSDSVGGGFSMDGAVMQAAENGTPWVSQYGENLDRAKTNLAEFVNNLKKTLIQP